jgi:outer membrane protein assembly factor BamB
MKDCRKKTVAQFGAASFIPHLSSLICLCACFLIFASTASAANWDRFRGPNGAGQSDDAGIPTKWEPQNFLWKQSLTNIGHSSPVIWGERLFLTSGDVKTGAQIVSAFDIRNGAPLWEQKLDAGTYHMNSLNSYASSTPAVDADHIYLLWLKDGRITLAALTHDGKEVWRSDIGPFKETHGFGKSPIVVDDLVYVANDSQAESSIVALDRKTGKPRWQLPRKSGITAFATPCVYDPAAKEKLLVAASTASGLAAVNSLTGKVEWQGLTDTLTERCVSSPIVAGGMVFVSCGQGGNGKVLVAARPGDGEQPPTEAYRLEQTIPNVPTPVVAGDLLFLWADRGVVSCYDLATGHKNWRERVGGDYHSSPLRVGDRIFGISKNGEVVVLAADRKFQVLARNPLNEPCSATPAVVDGKMYLRTESTLMCVGTPAGVKVN